jgi:HlyD family secretion protein
LAQARANAEGAKASLSNAEAEVSNTCANVKNAKALLEKSKVEAADAERSHARSQELAEKGLISETERETAWTRRESSRAQMDAVTAQLTSAEAQWRAAQAKETSALAQLKQAQASMRMAEANLKHTFITSPIDGVVISRNVDVGQTVAASLQAPVLFTIAQDLTKMQLIANVDEADVGRVRVGQEATFSVDAFPDKSFAGRIAQVRNAPIVVQNVVTYETLLEVGNPERLLKPGMTANISIKIEEKKNILRLPNAALRFRPPSSGSIAGSEGTSPAATEAKERAAFRDREGRTRAWTLSGGSRLHPVWVKLGISNGTHTEVVEGELQEGQEVVVDSTLKPQGGSPGTRGIRGIF